MLRLGPQHLLLPQVRELLQPLRLLQIKTMELELVREVIDRL